MHLPHGAAYRSKVNTVLVKVELQVNNGFPDVRIIGGRKCGPDDDTGTKSGTPHYPRKAQYATNSTVKDELAATRGSRRTKLGHRTNGCLLWYGLGMAVTTHLQWAIDRFCVDRMAFCTRDSPGTERLAPPVPVVTSIPRG